VLDRPVSFSDLELVSACVFRPVTLSGRIGQLLTTPPHPSVPAPLKQGLRESAEAYYRDVDWALDIAAAQFKDGSLYMMPGDKIGRDPATQFLLRRKTFEGMDRRDLPAIVAAYAGRFESTPFDSLVAAVSTLGANEEHHLADFEAARAAGLVE